MNYTRSMKLLETLLHHWLKIPYALHVEINRPAATRRAPTVLFIHGIGNSGAALKEVTEKLPASYRLVTIDLLGFGKSPRPAWAVYDAKTQARSAIATFLKLRIKSPVIIVGHSLGALVAVEIAKRYPWLVRALILCNPPFYAIDEETRRKIPNSDRILRNLYRYSKRHPEQLVRLAAFAIKLGLVNETFSLTKDNVAFYTAALEANIINQTSLEDAKQLKKPMTIILGRFDPVVVNRNIKQLAETNKNVTLTTVTAGHEVTRRFIPAITHAIIRAADRRHKTQFRP